MITSVYASLLALGFVGLSVRTLLVRRKLQIAVGDGADPRMLRAMRAHANFAEYVPITLIVLYLFEVQAGSRLWVHAFGGALVVGRALHAWGLSHVEEDYRFRVAGMGLTLATLGFASLATLVLALPSS